MKQIAILGSTGSVGKSALAVIDAHPTRLRVVGLAAGGNVDALAPQVRRYRPEVVALASDVGVAALRQALGAVSLSMHAGREGLVSVATHPSVDLVLCASAGTEALEAVLAAIDAGKSVAIANKEVLVMAGGLVMEAARRTGVSILPVDSEHSAIQQCLQGRAADEVQRLILTASGGPFLGRSANSLREVSAAEALQHPTWQMGPKITIDSATLMNKGLEIIEARWLFDVPVSRLSVVVHPQSIVHSIVELRDGSMIAQMGTTDMRGPIQYAFSHPERWPSCTPTLELTTCGPLEFREPAWDDFPCLRLAYRALLSERSLPIVLNAANEVAVGAFLGGHLPFTAIAEVIASTMDAYEPADILTLKGVREVDRWSRAFAAEQSDRRVESNR